MCNYTFNKLKILPFQIKASWSCLNSSNTDTKVTNAVEETWCKPNITQLDWKLKIKDFYCYELQHSYRQIITDSLLDCNKIYYRRKLHHFEQFSLICKAEKDKKLRIVKISYRFWDLSVETTQQSVCNQNNSLSQFCLVAFTYCKLYEQ